MEIFKLVKKADIPENLVEHLSELLKKNSVSSSVKRIQCILFKVKYNKTPEEIAEMVGYHPNHVVKIQALFWRKGDIVFQIKARGGRKRENLKIEEEKELIDKFNKEAEKGGILEVSRIKTAYEAKIGKKVPKSTVYRMLDRHNWREVVPRTKHPKSDKEAQENFKKTSQKSQKKH